MLVRSRECNWHGEVAPHAQVHDLLVVARDADLLLDGARATRDAQLGVLSAARVAVLGVPKQVLGLALVCVVKMSKDDDEGERGGQFQVKRSHRRGTGCLGTGRDRGDEGTHLVS